MSTTYGDSAAPKPDSGGEELAKQLAAVDELAERVRLAGLALAAPLAELRLGQLEREAARAAARHGADDPETLTRVAAAGAATERFDQLRTEIVRARATPAVPEDDGAAISGVVTRAGWPVEDATVSMLVDGGRRDSIDTNEAGAFALPAPADTPIRLSVSLRHGGEVFCDRSTTTLKPGQAAFRQIEFDGAEATHTEPAGKPAPGDGGSKRPKQDHDIGRVASLAASRLGTRAQSEDLAALSVALRLRAAKIESVADLDELLAGERHAARDRLGLHTLADTDRLLAALRHARKDLGG